MTALRDDPRIADVTVHLRFRDALQIQMALRSRVEYLAALGPSFAPSRVHAEKVLAAFDDALYPPTETEQRALHGDR